MPDGRAQTRAVCVYVGKPIASAAVDEPVEKFHAPAKFHKVLAPYFYIRRARLGTHKVHVCENRVGVLRARECASALPKFVRRGLQFREKGVILHIRRRERAVEVIAQSDGKIVDTGVHTSP